MYTTRIAFIAAALAASTISCAPHARVGVYADVPGPPALSFQAEPYFVPLPGTYAYGLPDYDVDLYYADGYYWRPWQGRWYRSTYYDRGWIPFSGAPYFYSSLPRDWRNDYHSHRWRGRSWDYARVPRHEVEQNWSAWKRERRWDEDQRRYTGDRRWHDGGGRHTDRRDWDGRDGDPRGSSYQGRREPDRREQSRTDYNRREPDRREVDGRVYENREPDRRAYESREVESRYEGRPPAEYRSVDVERRPVERRRVDKQPVQRETGSRPVVQQRRPADQVGAEGRGQGKSREVTPRGRGSVRKDDNRDGIDDSLQRAR